ncbi:uncharacterized protein RCC_09633 [Lecanosticta acicola]|uniref:Uncharacterized protein RCC_09633 n=1 Tax=Lecanosticta acicola TaxID=111012 RepID=A0AAI9EBP8_9PEZI|nr:uncharacterized protein RCC_09633 [Lecanosticta acicola]
MAVGAGTSHAANGVHDSSKPIEIAIDLPQSPGIRVNVHLTTLETSILLFLTSSSTETAQGAASMGSFVYAMPDRYNPTQPMSTALYTMPSSLDFTTRIAKVLCRRLQKPCYVGCSINLSGAAGGGSVEEEMEAFRNIVEVVTTRASR